MGQQTDTKTEVLAGFVERVTLHNPENGFCVLRLKARGHRDLVSTKGHAAVISVLSSLDKISLDGLFPERLHGLQPVETLH